MIKQQTRGKHFVESCLQTLFFPLELFPFVPKGERKYLNAVLNICFMSKDLLYWRHCQLSKNNSELKMFKVLIHRMVAALLENIHIIPLSSRVVDFENGHSGRLEEQRPSSHIL